MPTTRDEFRSIVGHFATGVTVVTTAHDGEVRGMTASSFASVSLEPVSVLICVNREAITHRILSAAGVFCVNILTADQEVLSRTCARPDTPEAALEGVPFHRGETGSPILDAALAYLDCRVAGSFEFGTHTIFIGEVVDGGFAEGTPLIFYRSAYARLDHPA